jgi:hypothetical protein
LHKNDDFFNFKSRIPINHQEFILYSEGGDYALSDKDNLEKTVRKLLLRSIDIQGYMFHILRIENAFLGNYSTVYLVLVSKYIIILT